MRFLHISDNHSILYNLNLLDIDMIIHSGDFLPNAVRNDQRINIPKEQDYQRDWVIQNMSRLRNWLATGDPTKQSDSETKPFLLCGGNHDFLHAQEICDLMTKGGIRAYNITGKRFRYTHQKKTLSFYGFPWIPWMGWGWNYETLPPDMLNKVDHMVSIMNNNDPIDVLVAHCPIYGMLDANRYNQNIGNTAMANAFEYKIISWPKAYLCGHCHESKGLTEYRNGSGQMIYSNAATTQHVIEIP